ncbi:type VII secretion-associated serine protease mycosin [Streptomyces sp. NPDC006552]|uniref:type VII secretion-associated serine protease mycosin n=1 Tax=Streptomyces sp. NPDC006552 TaxID=3157179 RepID=UPI0033BA76E0
MPPTSGLSRRRLGTAASAALGLLLVGTVAAVPAQAESFRAQQWHLNAMKADQMWRTTTGKGITVAVLDTGVDADHPDLQGQVLPGKDLAPTESGDEQTDYDGHGTGMAGIIAGTGRGNGNQGAYGLAPGAKVLPIRLPDGAKGANEAATNARFFRVAAEGIRYAANHGAKVINISQGATRGAPELASAVDYALKKGSLIFAAVGNTGDQTNQVEYPAATPGVVGVTAIDKNGHRTSASQHGPQVDIAAPGMDIVHACGGKTGYCQSEGTSDATALASASAALIWSRHPDWSNNQVLKVILNTIGGVKSESGKRSDFVGYGAVRPRIALTDPGDPGPADKFPMSDYPVTAESPSAEASKGAGAGAAATDGASPAAAPASEGDDSQAELWIGAGAAALVATGGVVAFVTRRRRRDAQQLPSGAAMQQPNLGVGHASVPYGEQQPYGNQQSGGRPPYDPAAPGSSPDNPYRGY